MVHAQPFNANLHCHRWQEGCVGKQKQLVDDRRLLLKRKVEKKADIAFVNSSKRRLCSLYCENYTVKTILWKLYCDCDYTILYYTVTTCGDSRWVYTSLYYTVLLTVKLYYTVWSCDALRRSKTLMWKFRVHVMILRRTAEIGDLVLMCHDSATPAEMGDLVITEMSWDEVDHWHHGCHGWCVKSEICLQRTAEMGNWVIAEKR